MKKIDGWFLIGLRLYIIPHIEYGNVEALRNRNVSKQSIMKSLSFRIRFKLWRYTYAPVLFHNKNRQ